MDKALSAGLFGILMGIGLGIAVGRFLFDEGPYLAPADRSFGVEGEASAKEASQPREPRDSLPDVSRVAGDTDPASRSVLDDAAVDEWVRSVQVKTPGTGSGRIHGTVLTSAGEGVAGVLVRAHRMPTSKPGGSRLGIEAPAPTTLEETVTQAVERFHFQKGDRREVETDSTGAFEFIDLAEGLYQISAYRANHQLVSKSGRSRYRVGDQADFVAHRLSGVPVQVLSPGGTPVESALIYAKNLGGRSNRTYNLDWTAGEPVVNLPAGQWELTARRQSAQLGNNRKTVWRFSSRPTPALVTESGADQEVSLQLTGQGAIYGSLHFSPGEQPDQIIVNLVRFSGSEPPDKGALSNGTREWVRNDGDTFVFSELEPGSYYLAASRDYNAPPEVSEVIELGADWIQQDLQLPVPKAGRHIRMTVQDSAGLPLMTGLDFRMSTRSDNGSSSSGASEFLMKDGTWWLPIREDYIEALKAGDTGTRLFVAITSKSYGSKELEVRPGKLFVVNFDAVASLVITVAGYAGSDYADRLDVQVRTVGENGTNLRSENEVSADGTIRFDNQQVGEYEVELRLRERGQRWSNHQLSTTPVTLSGGEQRLTLTVPAMYSLRVRMGVEGAGANVQMRSPAGPREGGGMFIAMRSRSKKADAAGVADFEDLPAGIYKISCFQQGMGEMEVQLPGPAVVDFVPVEPNCLRVIIADPGGLLGRLGLRDGDLIIGFNGKESDSMMALQAAMMQAMTSKETAMTVLRGNKTVEIKADLRDMMKPNMSQDMGGSMEPHTR